MRQNLALCDIGFVNENKVWYDFSNEDVIEKFDGWKPVRFERRKIWENCWK